MKNNYPQTASVVIANAEKMDLYICKRQAFVFHKKTAIRIPVSDSSGSCDSLVGKEGLAVQGADGKRLRGTQMQLSRFQTPAPGRAWGQAFLQTGESSSPRISWPVTSGQSRLSLSFKVIS